LGKRFLLEGPKEGQVGGLVVAKRRFSSRQREHPLKTDGERARRSGIRFFQESFSGGSRHQQAWDRKGEVWGLVSWTVLGAKEKRKGANVLTFLHGGGESFGILSKRRWGFAWG